MTMVVVAGQGVLVLTSPRDLSDQSGDLGSRVVGELPFGSLVHIDKSSRAGNMVKVIFPYKGYARLTPVGKIPVLRQLDLQATSPTPACAVPAQVLVDTDFTCGDLLRRPVPAKTMDACCLLCTRHSFHEDGTTPLCAGWTFKPSDGTCWLKSARVLTRTVAVTSSDHATSKPSVTSGYNAAFDTLQFSSEEEAAAAGVVGGSVPRRFDFLGIEAEAKILRGASAGGTMPLSCCTHSKFFGDGGQIPFHDYVAESFGTVSEVPAWTLRTRQTGVDWLHQMPIGTGRSGALVGTALGGGVLPISAAGFYVNVHDPKRPRSPPPAAAAAGSQHAHFQAARAELLRANVSGASHHMNAIAAEEAKNDPMRSLQYLADLSVIFSPSPLFLTAAMKTEASPRRSLLDTLTTSTSTGSESTHGSSSNNDAKPSKHPHTHTHPHPRGTHSKAPLPRSKREELMDNLRGRLEERHKRVRRLDADPFAHQVSGKGVLDMRRGIFQETFVSTSPGAGTGAGAAAAGSSEGGIASTSALLHHREYFASEKSNVMASRFSCVRIHDQNDGTDSGFHSGGCLNTALSLTRDDDPASVMARKVNAVIYLEKSTEKLNTLGSEYYDVRARRALVHRMIRPKEAPADSAVPVASALVCSLVVCHQQYPMTRGKTAGQDAGTMRSFRSSVGQGGKDSIMCSGFDSIDIFTAVSMTSTGSDLTRMNETSVANLQDVCFKRLHRVVKEGYETVRERHADSFSKVMTSARLHLTREPRHVVGLVQTPELGVCASHTLMDRLSGDSSVCMTPGGGGGYANIDSRALGVDVQGVAVDPSSIQQAFQLGRYLLHSSSNVVVPNLAGLWADGPTSAWSGDYHFNINLQEAYWGADVTGMGGHLLPLGSFMARLAKKGRDTAQNMYGVKGKTGNGWVAHGFTDNSLSGGLRGEPYWSLCVTCGAWMALSMWEHLLFAPTSEWVSKNKLMSSVLQLLRGAAEFFTEYMFIAEDGFTHHTGPTTSPENSYILMHVNASTNSVCMVGAAAPQASHLAMSPALDASVLRQLASAFSLLSEWAGDMLPPSQYSEAQRATDRVTAAKLVANVASMPGGGLPVVGLAGAILEYPAPLSDAAVHVESRESRGRSGVMVVTEELDSGHRHFSSMHWLYPSSVLPLSGRGGQMLLEAAKTTLDKKIAAGGGHTAWSAGWEIALRARLRDVAGASAALTRLLRRYTTPNGLALHPPLDPVRFTSLTVKHGHMGPDGSHDDLPERKKVTTKSLNCKTCFTERAPQAQGLSFGPLKTRRGLETSREDKFQLDGHGALVGAVSELLLQSHLPGHLLLLPGINALTTDPGRRSGGSFAGLRARGDVTISAAWSARIEKIGTDERHERKKDWTTPETTHLLGATLAFNSAHPWLHSAHWKEGPHPGFWDISSTRSNGSNISDLPVIMVVAAPAKHLFIERSMCAEHLSLDAYSHLERGDDHMNLPASLTEGVVSIYIQVHSFPCTVSLCPSRSTCSSELAAELAIADPGPL